MRRVLLVTVALWLTVALAQAHVVEVGENVMNNLFCVEEAHVDVLRSFMDHGLLASFDIVDVHIRSGGCYFFGVPIPTRVIVLKGPFLTPGGQWEIYSTQLKPIAPRGPLTGKWYSLHLHELPGHQI